MPWFIAAVDGGLAKAAKSSLLSLLEKDVFPADPVPCDATWMVNAMAILQSITTAPSTFTELALTVFNIVTALFASECKRVDFVVDQYQALSVCELSRGAKQVTLKVRISNREQECPTQWKKYLCRHKQRGTHCFSSQ